MKLEALHLCRKENWFYYPQALQFIVNIYVLGKDIYEHRSREFYEKYKCLY